MARFAMPATFLGAMSRPEQHARMLSRSATARLASTGQRLLVTRRPLLRCHLLLRLQPHREANRPQRLGSPGKTTVDQVLDASAWEAPATVIPALRTSGLGATWLTSPNALPRLRSVRVVSANSGPRFHAQQVVHLADPRLLRHSTPPCLQPTHKHTEVLLLLAASARAALAMAMSASLVTTHGAMCQMGKSAPMLSRSAQTALASSGPRQPAMFNLLLLQHLHLHR